MSVPDFQSLMLPTLRIGATGLIKAADCVERLSQEFGLSSSERDELNASGQAKIFNRTHWAITYLVKAGLLNRPKRGFFTITEREREVLAAPPERIGIPFLTSFDDFIRYRSGTSKEVDSLELGTLVSLPVSGTPDERIDAATSDLNSALRADLLERIHAIHPTRFEQLIVDLMLAMGYGADGSGERVGRTNDGGIDGIINEDVLGLDIIYLQAKRYAAGNTIGVEKIREFAGSLDERGATKGVFVTTSHFAPQALNYAQRSPKRLILIDGERLAQFLVRYGVGVRIYRTIELKRLDADYFDDLSL